MVKIIDRILIGILAISTLGHLVGTFMFYESGSEIFAWSLAGALASSLVVGLSLRRSLYRDRFAALLALYGGTCWITIVVLFGSAIGNVWDPRILMHALSTLGLCIFSILQVAKKHV